MNASTLTSEAREAALAQDSGRKQTARSVIDRLYQHWSNWARRRTALRLLDLAERYEATQPSVAADLRAAATAHLPRGRANPAANAQCSVTLGSAGAGRITKA